MTAFFATAPETFPIAHAADGLWWAGWILWLPLLSMVLCGACAALRVRGKAPAWITVALLGASFILTCVLYAGYEAPVTIDLFRWFDLSWGDGAAQSNFVAAFGLYVDRLTLLWMLFVTGLGTLIALYASEYMEPDVGRGYARFFAGVSVFLFAMGCLVMADNLLLLYLGWEGVGFASYWLIGYYYQRPSAVAAAKKAFIVNRVGDLGLALGIWLTWSYFGTVEYDALFTQIAAEFGGGAASPSLEQGGWQVRAIPFLFMIGAFGKSAQLPLYVWLPDAMEGPTPVSALIHAATMVTAGVYLVVRMFPVMQLDALALPTVAWIGGLTALLAATIGMAQYDIKRIMAYSTVSQLGYMFLGAGVLTTTGAAYHVFTHAFFKAVLFLACGAIMHGFAGQLDLRKISGLRRMPGWSITSWTMLYACLCLCGFPVISSGFWSKDEIIAAVFASRGPGWAALGAIALFTALLTSYYAFRVWFRVCAGESRYEMGEDHHGAETTGGDGAHGAHGTHAAHGSGASQGAPAHGHGTPHPPRFTINFVLVVISIGAAASIFLGPWVHSMVDGSTALSPEPHAHGEGFWSDPHRWMPWVAGAETLLGIAIAWHFHLANRHAADALRARLLASRATRWLPIAMERKWYVDELYDYAIVKPLWWIGGQTLYAIDRYVLDLILIDGIARIPRVVGRLFQPLQNGVLQSYAVTMAGGIGLVALLVLNMRQIVDLIGELLARIGGGGGA